MTLTLSRTPRGNVTTRTNECTNPSFETGTAGWIYNWFGTGPGAGTNDRISAAWAKYGTWMIHKKWTAVPTGNDDAGFLYQNLPWLAGVTKSLTGYMLTPQSSQRMYCRVSFLDATGATIGNASGAIIQSVVNTWMLITATLTAPAGTVQANVYFVLAGGDTPMQVNYELLLDGVLFETTATPAGYFDGANGAAAGDAVAWTGTANGSSSIYQRPDANSTVSPVLVNGYDDTMEGLTVPHTLLSGAVVATNRAASPRHGTLTLLFTSRAAAYSARQGMAVPGTWYFLDTDTQPQSSMVFVVTGSVRVYQSDSRATWLLDVPFQELS